MNAASDRPTGGWVPAERPARRFSAITPVLDQRMPEHLRGLAEARPHDGVPESHGLFEPHIPAGPRPATDVSSHLDSGPPAWPRNARPGSGSTITSGPWESARFTGPAQFAGPTRMAGPARST